MLIPATLPATAARSLRIATPKPRSWRVPPACVRGSPQHPLQRPSPVSRVMSIRCPRRPPRPRRCGRAEGWVRFSDRRGPSTAGSRPGLAYLPACAPRGRADAPRAPGTPAERARRNPGQQPSSPSRGALRSGRQLVADARWRRLAAALVSSDDALWILRRYHLRVSASRDAGHNTHGDGTASTSSPLMATPRRPGTTPPAPSPTTSAGRRRVRAQGRGPHVGSPRRSSSSAMTATPTTARRAHAAVGAPRTCTSPGLRPASAPVASPRPANG